MFKTMGLENIYNFTLKIFVNLNLCSILMLLDRLYENIIIASRVSVVYTHKV